MGRNLMGDTFYLISLVITGIMSSSVFFYAGFLSLAPPREDKLVTKMRPHEPPHTAPAPVTTSNYLASVSRFFAVYSQRVQEKGMSYAQYRARLQYLNKQQTGIELRLTDPNLSKVERLRLERQNAYWGRAIREMLVYSDFDTGSAR